MRAWSTAVGNMCTHNFGARKKMASPYLTAERSLCLTVRGRTGSETIDAHLAHKGGSNAESMTWLPP
ncbi:hypothetical protein CNECB9_820002 [Cupriavidus necator]|uniref:Uncharacterized protein n=1 Tax=Cupriavidus necator TaxID=106590 RepID=A0A1K0JRD7_CUPNE|nr:hypothetical protein CNECB9_820002 [Cupriavidus necator]